MKYLEALKAFFALHTEFTRQTSSKSMRSDWQDFIAANRLPLRAYDWPEPGSFTANRLLERGTLPYTQEDFRKELREVLAFGKALPRGVGGYEVVVWLNGALSGFADAVEGGGSNKSSVQLFSLSEQQRLQVNPEKHTGQTQWFSKYLEVVQTYQKWLDAPEHLHVLQVEGEELYLNAGGLIPEKERAFRFHDEDTAKQYMHSHWFGPQVQLKPMPL